MLWTVTGKGESEGGGAIEERGVEDEKEEEKRERGEGR